MSAAPSSTPLSAPIGSLIAGAAVSAITAIGPYTSGARINWALTASVFIVTFGAVLAGSLYHVQIPSPVQQASTAVLATALDSAMTKLANQAPPTVIVHPAVAAGTPAAVSTDVPTR